MNGYLNDEIVGATSFLRSEGHTPIITTMQDTDPVAVECKKDRLDNHAGFSTERLLRKVGSIPIIYLVKYPDILSSDKQTARKAVKKFFEKHPEFRCSKGGFR